MFDAELDVSLCYPFWFISTIFQFYICWPLIVGIFRISKNKSFIGLLLAVIISFIWATIVRLLGYEEVRPWGSFFLHYLWEFVLGMWLAESFATMVLKNTIEHPQKISWSLLLCGAIVGMGLTGVMGWIGGPLKLYNDIPSLIGYLSLSLIVYKASCSYKMISWVNKFFIRASRFSYELYLVHSLVFAIMGCQLKEFMPLSLWIPTSFFLAYIAALAYNIALKHFYKAKSL